MPRTIASTLARSRSAAQQGVPGQLHQGSASGAASRLAFQHDWPGRSHHGSASGARAVFSWPTTSSTAPAARLAFQHDWPGRSHQGSAEREGVARAVEAMRAMAARVNFMVVEGGWLLRDWLRSEVEESVGLVETEE